MVTLIKIKAKDKSNYRYRLKADLSKEICEQCYEIINKKEK